MPERREPHGPEERAHALAGRVLGQYCGGAVGGPPNLQDALAVDQAAGPAELGAQLRPLLRDAAGRLALLRRRLLGAGHAADPLHALDAGRAVVDDDLHVRRGAGLSFFLSPRRRRGESTPRRGTRGQLRRVDDAAGARATAPWTKNSQNKTQASSPRRSSAAASSASRRPRPCTI